MIATRFRSVCWVGGVAVAALGCYLVSQRVAAERATLARVEAEIVTNVRQIRALETEIGTRAGMNQIERWNVEVLALSAPKASQFVQSDVQLAALVQPVQPAMAAPAVQQVARMETGTPAPRVTRVAYSVDPVQRETPRLANTAAKTDKKAPAAERKADDTPRLRPAVYIKPSGARQDVALLDDKLLGDLGRLAVSERTGGKRSR